MEPVPTARARSVGEWLMRYCDDHGYGFDVDPADGGRFTISIAPEAFVLVLTEELDAVDEVPAEQAAAAKYDWQRVPLERVMKGSGRLHLQLVTFDRATSWADRSRWTLVDKLPKVMAELADRAAAAGVRRDEEERVHRGRVAAWEVAVQRATVLCRQERALTRAHDQAARWAQARDLRAYAAAVRQHPDHSRSPQMVEWADQVQAQADRIDPLGETDESLAPPKNEELPIDDLDRHMPKGLTAAHSPRRAGERWS